MMQRMKLRVYRTLWGVLAETDGDKAASPFLDLDSGNSRTVSLSRKTFWDTADNFFYLSERSFMYVTVSCWFLISFVI